MKIKTADADGKYRYAIGGNGHTTGIGCKGHIRTREGDNP